MLSQIHESHLGITKCKQRARELLFCPGMASQIEEQIAMCEVPPVPPIKQQIPLSQCSCKKVQVDHGKS